LKSARCLAPIIDVIADTEESIWVIDADKYTPENIARLLDCYSTIREAIDKDVTATDTLVTKIILGVFGSIPAFDTFVTRAFGLPTSKGVNERSLKIIRAFYEDNKKSIDKHHIKTIDFRTGNKTAREYTKAKLIDMVGFIEGRRQKG